MVDGGPEYEAPPLIIRFGLAWWGSTTSWRSPLGEITHPFLFSRSLDLVSTITFLETKPCRLSVCSVTKEPLARQLYN